MARYTAVLDACVLVPIALTDTLLKIADRGLYRPLWSTRIVTEAISNIKKIHPAISLEQIQRRFADMDATFENACVQGWEGLEAAVVLPDNNDRHVVAAAIRGQADVIVTANLRDFPPDAIGALDIAVIHPDAFLLDQLDLAPTIVLDVLQEQAANTYRPTLTLIDLIARLTRAGVPGFADEVRRLIQDGGSF